MKTEKKKIGWWRRLARWFGLPLLAVGREAVKELIPDEHQPLENLAVLSLDISEDMINIHTDINEDNKQQLSDWWEESQPRVVATSLEILNYAAQKILERMAKGAKYKDLSNQEQKIYRVHKALLEN